MRRKTLTALGVALFYSYWLQVCTSTRIQSKESLNRVEVRNNGIEPDNTQSAAADSYILLNDTPKKKLSRILHSKKDSPTRENSNKLKATAMLLAAIKDSKFKDGINSEIVITGDKTNEGRPLNSSSSFISRIEESTNGAMRATDTSHQDVAKAHTSGTDATQSSAKTEEGSASFWATLPTLMRTAFARHLPNETIAEYVWYCSIGVFGLLSFACSCCCVDWLKTAHRHYKAHKSELNQGIPPPMVHKVPQLVLEAPKQTTYNEQARNQYKHKGRVIYEWQQTGASMTMFTKLPEGMNKQNLEVKIWPRTMKIGKVGKVPFLQEELFSQIDVVESKWDVLSNGELAITMCKSQPMTWPCVFRKHHPDKIVSR